jgi:hypothetical protein
MEVKDAYANSGSPSGKEYLCGRKACEPAASKTAAELAVAMPAMLLAWERKRVYSYSRVHLFYKWPFVTRRELKLGKICDAAASAVLVG